MFNTSSNNDFIFNSEAVDVNLLNGSKLGGVDSVGYSHLTEHMTETTAKFQLESYLHKGWK